MNLGSIHNDLEANPSNEPHHIIEIQEKEIEMPEVLKEDENTTVKCSICYLDLPVTAVVHPLACKHSFCRECYTEYLENKMKDFEVLKITCPQDGCPEIVTDERIKTILSEDRFQRYQDLVQKKLSHKSWGQKYCPKAGCYKKFTPDNENKFTVCACGTEICNTCSQFWHPGKPCIEIKDEEFAEYAKANNIKFCIVCKTAIDRVEGCLHVTCSVCDYEWCWNCGKQYSPKHVCKGEWDPSVPVVDGSEGKPRGKVTAVLCTILRILISPIALLGIILFVLLLWPLIIAKDNGRYRRQTTGGKFCMVITSLIVGIICLPIVLICLGFYVLFIFFAAILYCFSDPGYQQLIARRRRQARLRNERRRKKNNPRWKMKEGSHFEYTATAKPQNENEAENNDELVVRALDGNMRGPRIDINQIRPIDPPNFIIKRRHSLPQIREEADLEEIKFEKAHQSLVLEDKDWRKEEMSSGPRVETERPLDLFEQLKKIKRPDTPVAKQNISLPFESEDSEPEKISEKGLEQFEAKEGDDKDSYHKAGTKINGGSPQLIKVTSSEARRADIDELKEIQMKEALEIKIVE